MFSPLIATSFLPRLRDKMSSLSLSAHSSYSVRPTVLFIITASRWKQQNICSTSRNRKQNMKIQSWSKNFGSFLQRLIEFLCYLTHSPLLCQPRLFLTRHPMGDSYSAFLWPSVINDNLSVQKVLMPTKRREASLTRKCPKWISSKQNPKLTQKTEMNMLTPGSIHLATRSIKIHVRELKTRNFGSDGSAGPL